MGSKLFISASLLTIFTTCVVSPPPEEVVFNHPEYNVVCNENIYGAGEEGLNESQRVIRSQVEFEAIIGQMSSVNELRCSDELSTVNLNETDVICIIDQIRGTSGYELKVTRILETDENITVYYRVLVPDENQASVITQPVLFATVEKSDKEALFILSE